MRRIAVVLLTGAALGIAAAPAAAEDPYDSFTAPAGAQKYSRSDARLSPAFRYHLVVTGTATVSAGADSAQYDAQYCFVSSSPQCASPFPEDAAIGFALGKEGGGQSEADALYLAGLFKGISEFGEGTGKFAPFDAGNRYEQWFTPSGGYYNLYAMTFRKYPAGDGVTRSGGFTVTLSRTAIPGGGEDFPTPPSTPTDGTPGSDCATTEGLRIARPAGNPLSLPFFCSPEEFLASSWGLPMPGADLGPGDSATMTSPKLGSAPKVTVEVKSPKDTAVSVTDPGFKRFARMQCVALSLSGDHIPGLDEGLGPDDLALTTEVPFLSVSSFRQRFLGCVAFVNRLLAAAATREFSTHARAAAGHCRSKSIPLVYGSGSTLDRLRIRARSKPAPTRTLSVRCRRTAEGLAITVATRTPGQRLSSIVGSRLSLGFTRSPVASGDAHVGAIFRR